MKRSLTGALNYRRARRPESAEDRGQVEGAKEKQAERFVVATPDGCGRDSAAEDRPGNDRYIRVW